MKTFHIDFAPRTWMQSLCNAQPVACIAIVLGSALLITTLPGWMHSTSNTNPHVQTAPRSQPAAPAVNTAQAEVVNHAIMQLNIPWRDMFDAIEQATPDSIALIELVPEASKQRLKVTAQAKDSDAMLTYLEQLKHQSFFSGLVLTSHVMEQSDLQQSVRFTFEVSWARELF